jgi:hypothetical protein
MVGPSASKKEIDSGVTPRSERLIGSIGSEAGLPMRFGK